MSTRNSFNISVASTMAASLLIMIFGLITGSISARLLGVIGRGELASIQLYGTLFGSICASGIPAAVIFFTGMETKKVGEYYLTGIVMACLLSIPIAIGSFVAIPYLLDSQRSEIILAARFYLLFIPLAIVNALSLAILQGQMKMLLWNIFRIISGGFWLFTVVIMFYWGVDSPIIFSGIYLATLFLVSCLTVVISCRNVNGPIRFQKKLLRPLWAYSIPCSLSMLCQQSNLKLDQLFIAAILPPEFLGIYIIALLWSAAHSPIVSAVSYAIVPHIMHLHSLTEKSTAICRIFRTMIVLNLLLTTCLILITPLAIQLLFGSQFATAIPIAYILMVGSVFSNLKVILVEGLLGMGRPKIVTMGEFLGLTTSFALLPLLLTFFGLAGVATALVIGYFVTLIYLLFQLRGELKFSFKDLIIPRREDMAYIISSIGSILKEKRALYSIKSQIPDA